MSCARCSMLPGGLAVVAEADAAESALREVSRPDARGPGARRRRARRRRFAGHHPYGGGGRLHARDQGRRARHAENARFVRHALHAGAAGCVLGHTPDLVEAVRRAATRAHAPEPGPRADNLTEREFEVLTLLALGHTNAEIGAQLHLSVRTVEAHRAHLQRKLRRPSRAELVRYALDHGLLHGAEDPHAASRTYRTRRARPARTPSSANAGAAWTSRASSPPATSSRWHGVAGSRRRRWPRPAAHLRSPAAVSCPRL